MFLTSHIVLLSSLFYIIMTRHMDFRERFLERKRLRALKDQRITVLNNNFKLKNTEILDDITHYRIKKSSSKTWKKIRAIEKDFRRLLAMDGMKYNYKRDLYWRTWRSMPPVNNATNQIVCYKCNNPVQINTTECHNCGMWTIEERAPPCPYEFFSVISDDKLCGANYTQYKDINNTCPSIIKFSDLTATCDNPIETQWRFSKMYGVTETYDDDICKNKDYCEIFTSYEVTPEHVIFRIINSTNDVIYSRIMKQKNKNYICIEDCGRFNPNTKKVAKADKPLKLDLLIARKTKREDVLNGINDSITKTEDVLNEMNDILRISDVYIEMNKSAHLPTEATKTEELMNEIVPPTDENMSLSNVGGNDSIIDNIEENSLHKIKSREMKRRHSKEDSGEERYKLEPTVTSITKTEDVLNEMNDIIRKSDVFIEMNKSAHLPTEATETEELMNEIVTPTEENMSLSNVGGNDSIIDNIEENSLHKIKSREMKRRHSKEDSEEERYKIEPTVTSITKTEDVLNEMNNIIRKSDVFIEMNKSAHLPTEATKTEELMNEIVPPTEENMSLSNVGGNDSIIDNIEENSLHKIKSREMKRRHSKEGSEEERYKLEPTVTPCQKLEKETDHVSYEDEKEDLEYS